MKKIITHYHPDVDAVTSVWLIKTFLSGWEEADIVFVPAGGTYHRKPPDVDPDIIHVDTGLGKFDHHQTREKTCAARLVFDYLRLKVKESKVNNKIHEGKNRKVTIRWHEEALDRLTKIVVDIDNFGHVNWPDPTGDIYNFSLESMLDGWKLLYRDKEWDRDILEQGMKALDGIYQSFINKVWAEHEISEKAITFNTDWGDIMAIESVNDDTLSLAQKKGYNLVIRKDPRKGYVRIKARPGSKIDLTLLYNRLKKTDLQATWYLHASRLMILNGSTKNPKMKSTKLSLNEIIDIIKRDRNLES